MSGQKEEELRRVYDRMQACDDAGSIVFSAISKIPHIEGEIKNLNHKYDTLSESVAAHNVSVTTRLDLINKNQDQLIRDIKPIINMKSKLTTYLAWLGGITLVFMLAYVGSTDGLSFLKSIMKALT